MLARCYQTVDENRKHVQPKRVNMHPSKLPELTKINYVGEMLQDSLESIPFPDKIRLPTVEGTAVFNPAYLRMVFFFGAQALNPVSFKWLPNGWSS